MIKERLGIFPYLFGFMLKETNLPEINPQSIPIEPRTESTLSTKERKGYKLKEKDPDENYFKSLKLKLEPETENRIITNIFALITQYETKLSPWREEWQVLRDNYENDLPEKTYPWKGCCSHHEPIIQGDTDAVTARVTEVLHGKRPNLAFVPTEKADIEACNKKEKFIDYEFDVEMKIEEETAPIVFDGVLLGTGLMKLTWERETRYIKDIETYKGIKDILKFLENYPDADKRYPDFLERLINNETIELIVGYDDEIYNAPKAEHIKLDDVILDPGIKKLEKQRLIVITLRFTRDELLREQKEGYFDNIDDVLRTVGEGESDTEDYIVYECIYKCRADKDKFEKTNIFYLEKDKQKNLRGMSFPYWHMKPYLIPFYYEPRGKDNGFFRRGLGYRLLPINQAADTLIRQAVDNNTLANVLSFTILDDGELQPSVCPIAPGSIIPVSSHDSLKKIETNVNPGISMTIQLFQLLKRSKEDASGVSPYMTGRESPTDPHAPAAKTETLLFESNQKLARGMKIMQRCFKEVGFQTSQLFYQFMPPGKEYRILGKDGYAFEKMAREDVRIRGDYTPAGSMDDLRPEAAYMKNQQLFRDILPLLKEKGLKRAEYELVKEYIMSTSKDWEKKVDSIWPDLEEATRQTIEDTQKMRNVRITAERDMMIEQIMTQGADWQTAAQQASVKYPDIPPPEMPIEEGELVEEGAISGL